LLILRRAICLRTGRAAIIPPLSPAHPIVPHELPDQLQTTLGIANTIERELGGRVRRAVPWIALTFSALALGILLTGPNWPRGFHGNVIPHGAVFSR
jgi:hypothetical protein